MRLPHNMARLAATTAVALSAGLLGAAPAWASQGAAPAAHETGYVRLAHLSPNTPPVDVYLYSFGNARARLVLHHVAYGTVSPYEVVPAGEYTVSMRAAGARPSTKPVLSTGVLVNAGQAYTVAGMGPAAGLRLQVLKDTLAVPKGRALVRVIQASLRQHMVKISLGRHVIARRLRFASTTSYLAVAPGGRTARAAGAGKGASLHVSLKPDTTNTLVVLDGASGLRLSELKDAAGSAVLPSGGAATGFGGTAPRPAPSPLPWLGAIAAGVLVAGAGALRYRRTRPAARRIP